MEKILVLSDCEGPLTKDDNAFKLTEALAERCGLGAEVGRKFFERMSVVDDIWGDFGKVRQIDPTYSSGHTLKVILPFFKAMGANREIVEKLSADTLMVVPNVKKAIAKLRKIAEVFIISTSYDFYLKSFCRATQFPFKNVRCTRVKRFNEAPTLEINTFHLLGFMEEVAAMPVIKYDRKDGKPIKEHSQYYERITDFIWKYVYKTDSGLLMKQVIPVGQKQKAQAVAEITKKLGYPGDRTMYVGDSQTDVQAVKMVKERGGLTMMFNGKGPVCAQSDLMYIGENALCISCIADYFARAGKNDVIKFFDPPMGRLLLDEYGEIIGSVTPESLPQLEEWSVAKRKKFRGVHIGSLT